jgi:signal transduction histidine kinase
MEDTLLIEKLQVANALTARLGTILSIKSLTRELAQAAREITQSERAAILLVDSERATFSVGAVDAAEIPPFNRTAVSYSPAEPAFAAWLRGESYLAQTGDITAESPLSGLMQTLEIDSFYSLPLLIAEAPAGVIIVANQTTHPLLDLDRIELLDSVQASAEIAFANATLYSQTVAELDVRMQELEMMRQIDRELSDTIQLERVFDLTLDWALRYTVAQGASLALYSSETDELRFVADLGYSVDQNTPTLNSNNGGIALRVARSGEPAMVADALADPDYIPVSSAIRSHMSVPLLRDDVVIAVITLESRRLNAFTEDHLQFVDKLAARAGVAIDNARLYSESVREREKLSHILSEIADIVIVVGIDDRMILINQSGIAALGQNAEATNATYVGRPSDEALAKTPLLPLFQNAKTSGQMMVDEVELNGDRTYYAEFSPQAEIGWIIVMHDITPLKETDELKSELVATVSHDLKQPLSVMNGYLELLQMSHHLDPRGENFVRMIARSIDHMRHLIDDVLDLAKIESGIALQLEPLQIEKLILECIENVSGLAENKSMQIASDFAPDLPKIAGDPNRLQQIFSNLIGNAVKYTQRGGSVHVMIEALDHNLRFTVRDNGMGISPEEQAHIFDRFYRVRRPETENIEGTGLGLAIVKKLIEAHKGTIGVESSVGEGTAFYVTLPIYEE